MENFILYISDQFRMDSVGINKKNDVITPNLDRLATDGINFNNVFCQNPVCVPSRCSMVSGLYPHTTGYRTMHYLMQETDQNFLKELVKNDYEVLWCGKNDFLKTSVDKKKYCTTYVSEEMMMQKYNVKNEAYSIENIDYPYKYSHMRINMDNEFVFHSDEYIVKEAIEFLENKNNDKPFFLFLTGFLPHPPYFVDQKWIDKLKHIEIDEPIRLTAEQLERKASILKGIRSNQKVYEFSNEELKELKAIYYAMGSKLDFHVGELISYLKANNLYETTTIIFTSDHGDYTGDYEIVEKNQNTFEDLITNVPLIIKPSNNYEFKKRTTNELVELIDIQATVLEMARIKPDYTHFGKSITQLFNNEDVSIRDFVICEGGRLEIEGQYAMDAGHDENNEYWPRTIEQTKIPEHSKAIMIRTKKYKYVLRLYENDELYDLEKDPYECDNLISLMEVNIKLKKISEELKNELLKYIFMTSDTVSHIRDSRF